MRRICLFLLLVVFVFAGCSSEYDGWQKVPFEGGSFKIPGDWSYHMEGQQMYIEKDGQIIMNQVQQIFDDDDEHDYFTDKNKGTYQYVKPLEGGLALSNSASIAYTRYLKDGESVDIWAVDMDSGKGDFWIWSDEISYDMMYRIANSYVNHEQ